jgi:hypothetical protein
MSIGDMGQDRKDKRLGWMGVQGDPGLRLFLGDQVSLEIDSVWYSVGEYLVSKIYFTKFYGRLDLLQTKA